MRTARSRRSILALSGAMAGLPLAVRAQATRTPFRLGIITRARDLASGSPSLVMQELRRLGLVEGRDFQVEARAADGNIDLYPRFARELAEAGVDAIFTGGGDAAARAALQATRTIPVVIFVDDAIRAGFVSSLARPTGNVTGVSLLASELDGKRQALLGEALPEGAPVAALGDSLRRDLAPLEAAAAIRRQSLLLLQADSAEAIGAAIADARARQATGINVLSSSILFGQSRVILERAFAARLPSMFQWPELAREELGLMAYGPPFQSIIRQLAVTISQLVAGVRPPALPVQQPTQIDLVINLRTAKALGIAMPASLLARANDVIE